MVSYSLLLTDSDTGKHRVMSDLRFMSRAHQKDTVGVVTTHSSIIHHKLLPSLLTNFGVCVTMNGSTVGHHHTAYRHRPWIHTRTVRHLQDIIWCTDHRQMICGLLCQSRGVVARQPGEFLKALVSPLQRRDRMEEDGERSTETLNWMLYADDGYVTRSWSVGLSL